MDNDTLLAEEMQEQVRATHEIVRKLETEIQETMESLELETAAAEARRLRADQGVASLTREQGQMVSAGRKHAALIVKWWLWGLLLGWLLAIIVSVLVSPVLGFIVVVPILAIFLTMGYASSSVEMKVDIANLRKECRRRGQVGSQTPEVETEEFIETILDGVGYPHQVDGLGGGSNTSSSSSSGGALHHRRASMDYHSARRGGGDGGGGGGGGGVLSTVGGGIYNGISAVGGTAMWLLGFGKGGTKRD